MTVYEIRFVVDQGPNDGKPNGIKPLGLRFTPAQWLAYVTDDTATPGGWGPRVGPELKREYGRLRGQIIASNEVQVDGTKTEEQMREEAYGPAGDADEVAGQLAANLDRMNKAGEIRTKIAADGEDTNWGFGDLRTFGVLLADLSANEVRQLFMTKLKATHPLVSQEAESARSERILYDPPVFPAARVARWRDGSDLVDVNRSQTPFLYSDTSWHETV